MCMNFETQDNVLRARGDGGIMDSRHGVESTDNVAKNAIKKRLKLNSKA